MKKFTFLICCGLFAMLQLSAQCPTGEVEVNIIVSTDDYGYEGYWQLVPSGNSCGTGTIFSGGNSLVGCSGGGSQNQNPGGYGNNVTITAGPFCLTQGSSYDIIFVDDYADGGFEFTVEIDGFPVYIGLTGSGDAPGTALTFVANPALAIDVRGEKIDNPTYATTGNLLLKGMMMNRGTDTINYLDLNYSIDNGATVSSSVNSINLAPYNSLSFTHPTAWVITTPGTYTVKMWASNINGAADMNTADDTATKVITVGLPVPNIIDDYIGAVPILTEIANAADGILVPRDLDFHPVLSRNELWVVLKSTEAIGGKTVKISSAGQPGQTELTQIDGNAWHFMSLPTGIAFSDNENFATSPGVFDANHNGGSPFTGPALWSSDPAIYAQPSGGNGSHLDMLHESPYSMGICHDEGNAFWVFDGYAGEIVFYDFNNDHGPGAADHSDGVIRRYTGLTVVPESTYHVPSHLILQKESSMLYIVDTGNDRILKMDVTSGVFQNNLTPYEPTAEYANYSGASWSVFADTGLVEPSGIDQIGNRIIVSDHANGNIIIYDNSGSTGVEIGRIVTGTPGIMGVKIGPDGKIWYVNATTNQVIRIDGNSVGINEDQLSRMNVYPNPATNKLNISLNESEKSVKGKIISAGGKVIREFMIVNENEFQMDISDLSTGVYVVQLTGEFKNLNKTFVKN